MINRLIQFSYHEDFGGAYYVQVLTIQNRTPFQASVSWNDYPSWPYLQIRSGTGDVLSILFWAHKFGFDFTFIARTWNWDRYDNLKDV